MPFSKWSTEQVCDWLEEIGLGQYGILARHWVTSGQTLLSASPQDLERVRTHRPPHLLLSHMSCCLGLANIIILHSARQIFSSSTCPIIVAVCLSFWHLAMPVSAFQPCLLVSPSTLSFCLPQGPHRTSMSLTTGSF